MRAEARAGARPVRVLRPAGGEVLERLLVRNLFANGGHVLIRAEVMRATGGFRADLGYGEDWEFLIRIALRGRFTTVAEPRRPVLFARRRPGGGYLSQAGDAFAFAPCMEAIYANPALQARFGARLPAIRARAEAENRWVIGRARLLQSRREGLRALRSALAARPSLRRAAFTLAAHARLGSM